MSDYIGFVVLALAAAAVAVWSKRRERRQQQAAEDAYYASQRTPGMGDPRTMPERDLDEHCATTPGLIDYVNATARTRPYLAALMARSELTDEALAERLEKWGGGEAS